MIFGLKKVPHRLIWLSYDDVATPTSLIGKKLAPILHVRGEKPMPESMDIIKRIDEDPTWGPPMMQPASGRPDLKEFEAKHWPTIRRLLHTRFVKVPLPDLTSQGARDYFINQHPVEGPAGEARPDAKVWKEEFDFAKKVAWYDYHLEHSEPVIAGLNADLAALEQLIHSEHSVTASGVGYDDVIFFCRMRPITLVKGIKLGPKFAAYLENMSLKTDIPLLTSMAL